MENKVERPKISDWCHPDKETALRQVIQSWAILAGIEPVREYAIDQVAKLKSAYPDDYLTIDRLFKEVWG